MKREGELDWARNPFDLGELAKLRPKVDSFLKEHPFDTNVFVMMRYRETEHFQEIEQTIRQALARHGLETHLAKDRAFSDDLWENIRIYMHACNYGIAVFEQIDEREFNPNISLELGYMYAWGKRCLLLKDRRMPSLPTDMCGKLYKDFDTYNIRETVTRRIDEWVRDLGSPWKEREHRKMARRVVRQIALDEQRIRRTIDQAVREIIESGVETWSIDETDDRAET